MLIDDGKLVGYMQDRQNARLMGMAATGNGRRESYAHVPMPRMTNTYMLAGDKDPAEIIASVQEGHLCRLLRRRPGGHHLRQVRLRLHRGLYDRERQGGAPVKGAMLIGNGPDAMQRITMIGNDMKLDTGIGNCGKGGQWVPVGVGQPHLRMDQMTVGGTRA